MSAHPMSLLDQCAEFVFRFAISAKQNDDPRSPILPALKLSISRGGMYMISSPLPLRSDAPIRTSGALLGELCATQCYLWGKAERRFVGIW